MDWLTFISKIIDSLAWPASIAFLFYLLRNDLPTIAKYIKKLKYKDLEMEFGESLKAVDKETKEAIPAVPDTIAISGQTLDQVKDRLNSIAELAPRSAILEAWLQVESAAVDVVRKKGISDFKSMPGPMRLRDYLIKGELLNKRQIAIFEQLRVLRNEAVHVADAEFTNEAVSHYISSALIMAAYLEEKSNEL
jgi:hypothetical protein